MATSTVTRELSEPLVGTGFASSQSPSSTVPSHSARFRGRLHAIVQQDDRCDVGDLRCQCHGHVVCHRGRERGRARSRARLSDVDVFCLSVRLTRQCRQNFLRGLRPSTPHREWLRDVLLGGRARKSKARNRGHHSAVLDSTRCACQRIRWCATHLQYALQNEGERGAQSGRFRPL